MSILDEKAEALKELADKIIRCAERIESYEGILHAEQSELSRLKKEYRKAQVIFMETAVGKPFNCIPGYMD